MMHGYYDVKDPAKRALMRMVSSGTELWGDMNWTGHRWVPVSTFRFVGAKRPDMGKRAFVHADSIQGMLNAKWLKLKEPRIDQFRRRHNELPHHPDVKLVATAAGVRKARKWIAEYRPAHLKLADKMDSMKHTILRGHRRVLAFNQLVKSERTPRLFKKGEWVAWLVQDSHGPMYGVAVVDEDQKSGESVSLREQDKGTWHMKPAHVLKRLGCFWADSFKPVRKADWKPPHYPPGYVPRKRRFGLRNP